MRVAFMAALVAAALFAATAEAIPIHKHIKVPVEHERTVGLGITKTWTTLEEVVRVEHVPPEDSDDDGYPDAGDDCPSASSTTNGGCPPPAPEPVTYESAPAPSSEYETVYSEPAPAPATTTSGGCPSYMSSEASSPTDVNPSSGAAGCYQVLPSTAAAMGSACSDVNAPSCVAAICAAQGNGAWSSSGATPCG